MTPENKNQILFLKSRLSFVRTKAETNKKQSDMKDKTQQKLNKKQRHRSAEAASAFRESQTFQPGCQVFST